MFTIVLGIDPGYGRCGFGIVRFEGNSVKSLSHGVITTKKETDFSYRLAEIAHDVEALIAQFNPTALVIEELFFAQSTTTALKVAEVRGMIRMIAARKGMKIIEVKPIEVKLALTGYGRADKKQMQQMVKEVFCLKHIPKLDDAADALAIAWTGVSKAQYAVE